MITIGGQDIYATWGLEPIYKSFNNSLMKFPAIKERVSESFEDEHGIRVLNTAGKVKDENLTVSFLCNGIDGYNAFIQYLVTQKVVELRSSYIGKVYQLEYMASTTFNDYKTFCTFGVRFRERNPRLRTGWATFDLTFDETFD